MFALKSAPMFNNSSAPLILLLFPDANIQDKIVSIQLRDEVKPFREGFIEEVKMKMVYFLLLKLQRIKGVFQNIIY